MDRQEIQNNNIVVVTHVFSTGPAQELEEYLKGKVNLLIFIGHPFKHALDTGSFCKIYKKGVCISETKAIRWIFPDLLMFVKDFLYTFFWVVSYPGKINVYIGADPLNALVGVLLKKMGKVGKCIFYTIDYVPTRFNNRLMNFIYHRIDRICVRYSDFVWNLSEKMSEARQLKGIKISDRQVVVPIGVNYNRIVKTLDVQKKNNLLIYMGHLRKGQGLELIIESIPDIVKKIPNVKLAIIGMGELRDCLSERIEKLGLGNCIEFKGYIKDHRDVEKLMLEGAVGLAMYEPDPNSVTWYADPSKPKQYMACGLPVIITDVPTIAEDVRSKRLGLVINYDKHDLIEAVVKLLTDADLYKQYRNNAINFASTISWDRIFDKAFSLI